MQSIRFRLMSLIALFVVGSLLLVSGSGYYFSEKYLEESLDQIEQTVAATAVAKIQSEMEVSLTQLAGVASSAGLQSGNKAQILSTLKDAQTQIGKYDHIFFASPDGVSINDEGNVANYADREYFQVVIQTRKPYISEPYISRTTNKQSVSLAVPVIHSGQVIGVLWGTYSGDRLMPLVKSIQYKRMGYGAIIDGGGVYLSHPTRPELVGNMDLKTGKITEELKNKFSVNAIDPKLMNAFKEVMEKDTRIRLQYKSTAGVDTTGSLNVIPLPGGQRWVLLLSTSTVDATSEVTMLSRILIGLAVIAVLIVLLLTYWASGTVVRPILRIRSIARAIATGDLSEHQKTIYDKSEIGQLADDILVMNENLRNLVEQVQNQSHLIAASSEELTASAQQSANASNQVSASVAQMANGAEQQVVSVNETSIAVHKITEIIDHVAGAANDMAAMATRTVDVTSNGQLSVDKAVTQMASVDKGTQKAHDAARELEAETRQIGEIVALISNLAGQTNLLALNAAIEAARAGEQGRGFAVVAEEVRKLAEQSDNAAKQIKNIISKNNANIVNVVEAVDSAISDIQEGVKLVNSAGQGFINIDQQVNGVAAKVTEISKSLNDMAANSQNIIEAIRSVEQISRGTAGEAQNISAATQEQSASTQEIASSSQSLASLAQKLQNAVEKYQI